MDDNTRPHRARIVDAYKATNNITSVEWPALSPDMNPLENLWDAVQRVLDAHQPPVTTLQQLLTVIRNGLISLRKTAENWFNQCPRGG